MNGWWVALCGVVFMVIAVMIAFNTSMGGTRSDHKDGSGCFFSAGLILLSAGIGLAFVEYLKS